MPTDPNQPEPTMRHDTEAMVQLAKLWSAAMPSVEAFLRGSLPDANDRDDVIQATSEYLARNFHQYKPGTPFTAWAISVARYRLLELWRERSRDRLVLSDRALEALAEVAADMHDEISPRQEALSHCIEKLGQHQRDLLDLRYNQSQETAQIAEVLGKSPNAVSAALMRVRSALRRCIETRLRGADA